MIFHTMTVYMSLWCCNFGWLRCIFINKYTRRFGRELQICRSVVLYMIRLLCMFGGPIWFIIHVMVIIVIRLIVLMKNGSFLQK